MLGFFWSLPTAPTVTHLKAIRPLCIWPSSKPLPLLPPQIAVGDGQSPGCTTRHMQGRSGGKEKRLISRLEVMTGWGSQEVPMQQWQLLPLRRSHKDAHRIRELDAWAGGDLDAWLSLLYKLGWNSVSCASNRLVMPAFPLPFFPHRHSTKFLGTSGDLQRGEQWTGADALRLTP